MSTYDFTFVIPSFNEGRYLQETVDSILETAGKSGVEVIAVDDHSDDYSGLELSIAYRNDKRVDVISGDTRLGAGAARQLGAQRARGDTLVFLDAHSRMPEGWPELLKAAIARSGKKVLYGTALYPLTENGFDAGASEAHGVWLDTPDLNEHYCPVRENTVNPYPVMAIPGGSIVIDRAFFHELGGFDPGIMPPWGQEVLELSMRTWAMGYEVRIIPTVRISTLYKPPSQANPGIKTEYLLYNRLRIALLYLGRDRAEKVLNELRMHDWFDKAMGLMFYERYGTLLERSIELQRHPEEVFERFGLNW